MGFRGDPRSLLAAQKLVHTIADKQVAYVALEYRCGESDIEGLPGAIATVGCAPRD
jgi:hypothetical protein